MQADYLLGYRIDKPLRMPQPAWEESPGATLYSAP